MCEIKWAKIDRVHLDSNIENDDLVGCAIAILLR